MGARASSPAALGVSPKAFSLCRRFTEKQVAVVAQPARRRLEATETVALPNLNCIVTV
jgi:hypothetical protein